MSQRQALTEGLKKAYTAYYDVFPGEACGELAALCAFHQRDSQYVLTKKAELWASESHEYLYLWSLDNLDAAALDRIFAHVLEDGESRVRPHAQHMFTYLTAVVLYDSAGAETLDRLKKLKKRREYKLSLHGWMEFRIAAVDASTGEMTVNRSGKRMEKDMRRLVGHVISKYKGEEKTQ